MFKASYFSAQPDSIGRFTILHNGRFKTTWDWMILVLILYTAIATPYSAVFIYAKHEGDDSSSDDLKIISGKHPILSTIETLVDVMFIIDILINFRTTYLTSETSSSELVSNNKKIASNYLKGWFFIDAVAAIPFDAIIKNSNYNADTTLIGLLKTARLLRMVRVARKVDRYFQYGQAVLVLLMFTFTLIAHWLACVWYWIGLYELGKHDRGAHLKGYRVLF